MIADQSPKASIAPRATPLGPLQEGVELDLWFITDMVLCNFECPYCCAYTVVTQEKTWHTPESYERFLKITERIAQLPYKLRIRMQTLGEPLVSREFLERAAWLTSHDNVTFVEMVTNGSLFSKRLQYITEKGGDLRKISLWTTFHHTEIKLEKFLSEVEYARDVGAFVVVNALAFPESLPLIEELHAECKKRGLRVNVDPGYRDGGASYDHGSMIPLLDEPGGKQRLFDLSSNKDVLEANLRAAVSVDGEMCSAGGDYFIILSDGSVGPCCPLLSKGIKLGSMLDENYLLKPGRKKYQRCTVDRRTSLLSHLPVVGKRFRTRWPCKNKEDFGHLKSIRENHPKSRSFGWFSD